MFKIECYCDDKYLAAVMHALSGKVLNLKTQSVPNATAKNGALAARTNGDVAQMLRKWIAQKKLTRVTATDIKQFQSDIGRSPAGYSNALTQGKKAGILKRAKGTKGAKAGYDVLAATK